MDLAIVVVMILDVVLVMVLAAIDPLGNAKQGDVDDDTGDHLGLVLNMVCMVNGLCDQSLDQSNCHLPIQQIWMHLGILCDVINGMPHVKIQPII